MQDTLDARPYGCPARVRMRVCTCKSNLLRSHVLHGGEGWRRTGEPRQRMNEWILRQSWVAHSRNRERAFEGRAFFPEERRHRSFSSFFSFFPFRGFPSRRRHFHPRRRCPLHCAHLAFIALNDRFVIRGYAERGFACLAPPLRFPPLAVFEFSLSRSRRRLPHLPFILCESWVLPISLVIPRSSLRRSYAAIGCE